MLSLTLITATGAVHRNIMDTFWSLLWWSFYCFFCLPRYTTSYLWGVCNSYSIKHPLCLRYYCLHQWYQIIFPFNSTFLLNLISLTGLVWASYNSCATCTLKFYSILAQTLSSVTCLHLSYSICFLLIPTLVAHLITGNFVCFYLPCKTWSPQGSLSAILAKFLCSLEQCSVVIICTHHVLYSCVTRPPPALCPCWWNVKQFWPL